MKRNYPGDDARRAHEEIIDKRLDQLFSVEKRRQISIANKGFYVDQHRHVRLDSLKGVSQELVCHSKELQYHFLPPFEALFCLESSELIIFYKGLPLSLAEAYHLLLRDETDYMNYRVFHKLNRTGYICLMHERNSIQDFHGHSLPSEQNDNLDDVSLTSIEPIQSIQSITKPFREALIDLQKYGPQARESEGLNDEQTITFDVYSREKFAESRPRKGRAGKPDYLLVVCDDTAGGLGGRTSEICDLTKNRTDFAGNEQAPEGREGRVLYAIIDEYDAICFVQFSSESSHESVLLQT